MNEAINPKFLLIAYEKSNFSTILNIENDIVHIFFTSFCWRIIQGFVPIFQVCFIPMFFCCFSQRWHSYCAMFISFCQGLTLRFYISLSQLLENHFERQKTILSLIYQWTSIVPNIIHALIKQIYCMFERVCLNFC